MVVALNFLDSVVRLPEEVYLDISVARRIIENLSSASVRTRLAAGQDVLLMK